MMDKKTIYVMIGCLLVLIVWQRLVEQMYPPKKKPLRPPIAALATNAPTAQTVLQQVPAAGATATNQVVAATKAELEQPRPAEQIAVLSNNFVRIEVTSWGGGIRSVELLKYKSDGHGHIVLNGADFVPALALNELPGLDSGGAYQLRQMDARIIEMSAKSRAGIIVTKKLSLTDDYVVNGSIEVVRPTLPGTSIDVIVGTATPIGAKEAPDFLGMDTMIGGKCRAESIWDTSGFFIFRSKVLSLKETNEVLSARWVDVKNQFFTMVMTPTTNTLAVGFERGPAPKPALWEGKEPPQGVTAWVTLSPTAVSTTGVERYEFRYYAGPKELDRLAALGQGQEDVMNFGFWGVVSVILLRSMKFFYQIIPNYGVAIIIITVIIKLLFWPIQAKSIKSMKEMQKFQPLVKKLKEKYKDDPQRLNQETMRLYKEHKINPFAGCLPMLVQIPVFFALFAMLRSAIELRGATFLWIKDLSLPDTIFHVAGFPFNPLPLAMTGASFWQMKLTPQTGDTQQQKMMQFMPLMMLFFFYNTSSGLVLYWTVQQFLSVAQQWWTLRKPDTAVATTPAGNTR
ncbi:MAG: membrane protein insertase YidC [Verrucomicrobiia bacterium]